MANSRKRTTQEILRDVEENLRTAELGYRLLTMGNPSLKLPGIRNVVVFGRTVTFTLQNLRETEKDFDVWYEKYSKEMSEDPLMVYFKDLRNDIEKKGILEPSTSVYISHLRIPEDLAHIGPPPPGATSFFIGDHLGGSGWEIRLPDGSIGKYYVDLPAGLVSASLHFAKPPTTHSGKEIKVTAVEQLCRLYLDYLGELVNSAKRQFVSPSKA